MPNDVALNAPPVRRHRGDCFYGALEGRSIPDASERLDRSVEGSPCVARLETCSWEAVWSHSRRRSIRARGADSRTAALGSRPAAEWTLPASRRCASPAQAEAWRDAFVERFRKLRSGLQAYVELRSMAELRFEGLRGEASEITSPGRPQDCWADKFEARLTTGGGRCPCWAALLASDCIPPGYSINKDYLDHEERSHESESTSHVSDGRTASRAGGRQAV